MAEWFVGPVMEKLIDACSEHLKDQVRWQTGMPEELRRLREIHPKIQAVVSAYGQAQIEDRDLNKWLWQLRDAVDEADDVLDEFEYRKHEKQVSKNKRKRKADDLLEIGKRALEFGKRALKIDPDLKRLEEAVQKLDKVSAEVSAFLHLFEAAKQEQQLDVLKKRETGSTPKNNLLGRIKEMDFVKRWLRKPYQTPSSDTDLYRNISLLSVVGHGGIGKTTLLQHVYKDATLLQHADIDGIMEGFQVKMWVCVLANFDAKTVIKNILESLQKERPHLESLEALQISLQSEVTSKRFLLVLDDIWEEDEGKWEDVLAPLQVGNLGSKILITTRMNSIASTFAKMIIKNKETLSLEGLEEGECLQLLNTHAFAGVDPNMHKRLESIAEEMVKKLSGCPLAAKIIGGILNFKLDERYWRKVLNNDIGKVEPGHNDLLPILKLSYIYLPKYLQNCFAFCCIFPQDHVFDKDDLVRMWIALGFIQYSNIQGETLEEIGGSYFDILVRKSFFDEFDSDGGVYYKMHDLLHELAQFVSTQEFFRVVDDKEFQIPPTIRHLSIQTGSLEVAFKKMEEFKNLRSLFLSFSDEAKYDENFIDVLSNIFKASKSIRLLSIQGIKRHRNFMHEEKKIPDTINYLIHLRYLKLDQSIFKLPRSVSHLYHLQFLIYKSIGFHSCDDDLLLRDINNLYNLRYLRLPVHEHFMIYKIGKLKSLQELNYFYVKNEIGYGIGELKHMNELRQIGIYQLENIKDVEEACSAKFYDKKNLTDLSLLWGDDGGRRENIVDHDLDEKVLDSIQTYNNLKRLYINAYMGVRSAMWMSNIYLTSSNLQYIRLEKCLKWQTLPPFGQLPFLKSLYLYDMPEVEQLDHNKDCMFPSLEVLHIQNLKALQQWFDTIVAAQNGCLLPCLIELWLINCPKLQELPSLPTKLQNLRMDNIGWKACNWLQGIRNCSQITIRNFPNLFHLRGRQELKTNGNFQLIIDELVINDPSVLLMVPVRSISSFRSLTIKENGELVSFPTETEEWFPQLSSSLLELEFFRLRSLQSLPSSLECLSSLNTLRIYNVPQLKLLPELPSSLEQLQLENLHSLQCLPSSLSTISSLNLIRLSCILLLESLPDLPSSLEKLEIEELESLQCLPSSSSTISSLNLIRLSCIPLLESLPDLPSSLEKLEIEELESLQCLPSSLSAISSLAFLYLINIPLLKSMPDLPSSLKKLELEKLESLQCLPSSFSTISSLKHLKLNNIPLLRSLPDLPSSLAKLEIDELESLQCLPSLSTISSLRYIKLRNTSLLKSLPDLPSSLTDLHLVELENLDCLPSCLPALQDLYIIKVPQLLELPDLPALLNKLYVRDCHLQFMERYKSFG